MYILTENNIPILTNKIEKFSNYPVNYFIFDIVEKDFFCIPCFYLNSFYSPAIEVKIGNNILQFPLDWNILIGEKYLDDLDFVQIENCMDKDFEVLCLNPISCYKSTFLNIEILNIYYDIEWNIPKLKSNHILVTPLSNKKDPLCCLIVDKITKAFSNLKLSEIL